MTIAWALLLLPGGGEIKLFYGRDLSNFYTFLASKGRTHDPEGAFSVADGLLRASGRELGYLAREKEFGNDELTVEFKWGAATWPPREKAARDKGILFHMQGPDEIWPRSVEGRIIECASIAYAPRLAGAPAKMLRVAKGLVNGPGRAKDWKDILGFRAPEDLEKPAGGWITLVLRCKDGAFSYRVNGALAAEGRGAGRRDLLSPDRPPSPGRRKRIERLRF